MPKASKRASAHKFAVVSSFPRATIYTGTREQLIALGVARPEQFPEGRKRLKWDYSMKNSIEEGWQVKKLKDGHFELNQCHKHISPKAAPIPFSKLSITYCPEKETDRLMPYQYEIYGTEKLDKPTWEALFAASDEIIKVIGRFNARSRKNSSHLKLVDPMTATGGR